MKFSDYLHKESIFIDLQAATKEASIREMLERLQNSPWAQNVESVYSAVLEREQNITTGIGEGVALPHAKSETISEPVLVIGISEAGIEWNAMDLRPVHLIILILSPSKDTGTQLRLLASISRLIKTKGVAPILLNNESPEDMLDYFKEMEEKRIL